MDKTRAKEILWDRFFEDATHRTISGRYGELDENQLEGQELCEEAARTLDIEDIWWKYERTIPSIRDMRGEVR